MSALSFIPIRRVCLNCIRRGVGEDLPQAQGLSLMHVRGKKKKAKQDGTINVRLLVDMKGYGRKGAITPVAPGRMRNSWYPRQHAEYLSTASDINPKTVVAMRDPSFGIQDAVPEEDTKSASDQITMLPIRPRRTQLLDPKVATELLSRLLPPTLIFHRTAIEAEALTEAPPPSSRRATSQAARETYTDLASAPILEDGEAALKVQPIYGSVSTLDIAISIKDSLEKHEDGRRVVVGTEDITLLVDSEGAETGGDRLKALGEFPIGIRLKGGDVVNRTVSIRPPKPMVS